MPQPPPLRGTWLALLFRRMSCPITFQQAELLVWKSFHSLDKSWWIIAGDARAPNFQAWFNWCSFANTPPYIEKSFVVAWHIGRREKLRVWSLMLTKQTHTKVATRWCRTEKGCVYSIYVILYATDLKIAQLWYFPGFPRLCCANSFKGSSKKEAKKVWLGFFAEPFCKSMEMNESWIYDI